MRFLRGYGPIPGSNRGDMNSKWKVLYVRCYYRLNQLRKNIAKHHHRMHS